MESRNKGIFEILTFEKAHNKLALFATSTVFRKYGTPTSQIFECD
jgi:hypothetical protein